MGGGGSFQEGVKWARLLYEKVVGANSDASFDGHY